MFRASLLVAVGLLALTACSPSETASSDSPAPSDTAPPSLTYEETYAGFSNVWDSNSEEARADQCRRFNEDPNQLWDDFSGSSTDKVMVNTAYVDFFRDHCTVSEGQASPTQEESSSANAFYKDFGTFDPVKESGEGDSVVRLFGDDGGPPAVAVTASHSGESNFVIKSLGDEIYLTDLLVNTIGDYQGTTFLEAEDSVRLQISADGRWEVTVRPIADLEEVSTPFDGKGDAVVLYSGPAAEWKIVHNGDSNFVVKQVRSEDDRDPLVNEIGDYSGTLPVRSGPSVMVINADGAWTVGASD